MGTVLGESYSVVIQKEKLSLPGNVHLIPVSQFRGEKKRKDCKFSLAILDKEEKKESNLNPILFGLTT